MSYFLNQPVPQTPSQEIGQFHADAHRAAVDVVLDKAAEIGAAADYLTSRLLAGHIAEEVEVVEVATELTARAAMHEKHNWFRRVSKPPRIGAKETEASAVGEGWVVSEADGRNTGRIALLNDSSLVLCAPLDETGTKLLYDGHLNLWRYPVHSKFTTSTGYNFTNGLSEATKTDKNHHLLSKLPAKVEPTLKFDSPEAIVYANLEIIGFHMRKFFQRKFPRG